METNLTVYSEATSLKLKEFDLSKLNDFIDEWQVKAETKKTYFKGIKHFIEYMVSNDINTPTLKQLKQYVKDLEAKGLKPTTIKSYIASIKALYKHIELNDPSNTFKDIAKGIKAPAINNEFKKDFLTPAQITELVGSMDNLRDKIIILLGATVGLRTIEICRLNRNDIELKSDLNENTIKPILWVLGKARDEKEFVVISMQLYTLIQEYLSTRYDTNEALILSNKGRFTPGSLSRIGKTALRKIGINSEKFTFHSLRHSFCTLSIYAGNDIKKVQEMARHKSQATTEIYNHTINKLNNNCSASVMKLINI